MSSSFFLGKVLSLRIGSRADLLSGQLLKVFFEKFVLAKPKYGKKGTISDRNVEKKGNASLSEV